MKKLRPVSLVLLLLSPFLLGTSPLTDSLLGALDSAEMTVEEVAEVHRTLGLEFFYQDNLAQAMKHNQMALKLYEELGDEPGLATVRMNIGNIYSMGGEQAEALDWFLASLSAFEAEGDSMSVAIVYSNMGLAMRRMGNMEKAIEYYQMGLAKAPPNPGLRAQFLINIGSYYNISDSFATALDYYQQSLELFQEVDSEVGIAKAMLNIGASLNDLGEWDAAMPYHLKADSMLLALELPRSRAICLLNMADLFENKGQLDSAIHYNRMGLTITREVSRTDMELEALQELRDLARQQDRFQLALLYGDTISSVKDSLQFQATEAAIEKVENLNSLRQFKEKDESEIKLLEEQNRTASYRLAFFIGLALLVILGIAFWGYRTRTQKLVIGKELNKTKEQSERLQDELEYKNRELIQFAAYIVNKNQFLRSVKEMIESREGTSGEKLQNIKALIRDNLNLDRERKEFELRIQQINQSFFFKLTQEFPDLTEKDRRLASLVFLELSSKEIADIFNITVGSVEKSRHRLRKKLGLNSGESLTAFLKGL